MTKNKKALSNKIKAKNKNSSNVKPKVDVMKTKMARSQIGANWKTFLSQQVKTKNATDEHIQKPEKYTGPFRRARKLGRNLIVIPKENEVIDVTESSPQNIKIQNKTSNNFKTEPLRQPRITKYIAMDCEMVGVGENGEDSMLARVSLVNKHGECIYDKFVAPREEVVDYRTKVSGIRPEDLENATPFDTVVKEVADILRGKILVGHAIYHDLDVLLISHPKRKIRDTSRYKPFRQLVGGKTPGLRRLAKELLDVDIQKGEHSSVEDAKAAMQLYVTHSKQWEQQIRTKSIQTIT